MSKIKIKEATTSKLARIFVQDSSSTTGAGLTGLVYNSASLTSYWIAEGDASATSITLATMTVGTWASGGFKEVDATNMPGVYEIGLPDVCVDATSEGSVVVMLKGATNMAPVLLELELDGIDYTVAHATGSALATAQADLDIITGASGVNLLTATQASIDAIEADTNELQTDWADGGRLDLIQDIIAADTTTDIPALIATAQADLDTITGSDGATLATAQGNYAPAKVADILTTALTEAYAADGAAPTLTQAVMLILQHLSESSISSITKTVKKLDGSTSAATFTLDDATTPTSITRAT
jgi:hypothetical protein